MSFFFNRGKGRHIPPNATFRLTQEGRDKVQDFGGDEKSRILVALETRGTSDVDEISSASGVKRGKVEKLIPTMVHGGYVQYVSASSSNDGD